MRSHPCSSSWGISLSWKYATSPHLYPTCWPIYHLQRNPSQFYFLFSFGCVEAFFLFILAFDSYLAIFHQLHYPHIMTRHLCIGFVVLGWFYAIIVFLSPVVFISQLCYHGPNIINHFMCDPVTLSCSKDTTIQFIYSTFNAVFMIGTSVFIFCFHALVIWSVVQMSSEVSKSKAFFTYASHLAVMLLYYGSIMMIYVSPGSRHSVEVQTKKDFILFCDYAPH